MKKLGELSDQALMELIGRCTDERMYAVYEAIGRGVSLEELHALTKIDMFFLHKFANLYAMEKRLREGNVDEETYLRAKTMGYPDSAIRRLSGQELPAHRNPVYKMVDTCAAEFEAQTPYFYATYDEENEAKEFLEQKQEKKPCVVVLGSGPIRIGQGIEFDYASVHCVWMLKQAGYDVVIDQQQPRDRLHGLRHRRPAVFRAADTRGRAGRDRHGASCGRGGGLRRPDGHQTDQGPGNRPGCASWAPAADAIDLAEDRERFDAAMEKHAHQAARGLHGT